MSLTNNSNMNGIYSFTIPVFIKMLGGLRNILAKSQAYGKEKEIDTSVWINDRLAPDMFTLLKQVQVACNNAKDATARLAGVEPPKYEDSEKTLHDLLGRIDKTVDFLETFSEDSFKAAAEVKVKMPYFPGKYMNGFDYAREYAIPNFIFHVVVAYAILRKNGVPLGKADYINGLPLKDL